MILSTQNGGLTIKPVFFLNVGEPSNECGFCMSHMLHGAGKYLPTKLIFFGANVDKSSIHEAHWLSSVQNHHQTDYRIYWGSRR